MKHAFFFSFILCCCSTAFSQDIILKGKIVTRDDAPVPYATIFSRKTNSGTVSNSNGEFEFSVAQVSSDSLIVSHVGYQKFRISIDNSNLNLVVVLNESIVTLEEVAVLPREYLKNPNLIVKKAIQQKDSLNPSEPFVLNGYYREVMIQDSSYTQLIEADVSVLDYGFQTAKETVFAVNQLRRSYDFRKQSGATSNSEQDTYKSKQLNCWFKYNFNRRSSENLNKAGVNECGSLEFGVLDRDFLKEHKFKLDSLTELNGDLVYQIKILPNSSSKPYHTFPKSLIIPVGKIYIRAKDFAIMRVEYNYILNPKKTRVTDYGIISNVFGSRIIFQIVAIYQELNNQIYLSYLKSNHFQGINRENRVERAKDSPRVFDLLSRVLLVNHIDENPAEMRLKHLQTNSIESLSQITYAYDPGFWDNYNLMKETQQEEKLREDLEEKVSLDEQFRKGKKEEHD